MAISRPAIKLAPAINPAMNSDIRLYPILGFGFGGWSAFGGLPVLCFTKGTGRSAHPPARSMLFLLFLFPVVVIMAVIVVMSAVVIV